MQKTRTPHPKSPSTTTTTTRPHSRLTRRRHRDTTPLSKRRISHVHTTTTNTNTADHPIIKPPKCSIFPPTSTAPLSTCFDPTSPLATEPSKLDPTALVPCQQQRSLSLSSTVPGEISTFIMEGHSLADHILSQVHDRAIYLAEKVGRKPTLCVILVGGRPDSIKYVNVKKRSAENVGIDTQIEHLNENSSQEVLLNTIQELNKNPLIDGIIIQLPLPPHLDASSALQCVAPLKDVDGFHLANQVHLMDEENVNTEAFTNLFPGTSTALQYCQNLDTKEISFFSSTYGRYPYQTQRNEDGRDDGNVKKNKLGEVVVPLSLQDRLVPRRKASQVYNNHHNTHHHQNSTQDEFENIKNLKKFKKRQQNIDANLFQWDAPKKNEIILQDPSFTKPLKPSSDPSLRLPSPSTPPHSSILTRTDPLPPHPSAETGQKSKKATVQTDFPRSVLRIGPDSEDETDDEVKKSQHSLSSSQSNYIFSEKSQTQSSQNGTRNDSSSSSSSSSSSQPPQPPPSSLSSLQILSINTLSTLVTYLNMSKVVTPTNIIPINTSLPALPSLSLSSPHLYPSLSSPNHSSLLPLNQWTPINIAKVLIPPLQSLPSALQSQLFEMESSLRKPYINSLSHSTPKPSPLLPCTPLSCIALLDYYNVPLSGAHVVVLGRSSVVGFPLSLMLMQRGAVVTNLDRNCPVDVRTTLTKSADIIVTAVGKAHFVKHTDIKPGAVLIDVGINFIDKETGKEPRFKIALPPRKYATAATPISNVVNNDKPRCKPIDKLVNCYGNAIAAKNEQFEQKNGIMQNVPKIDEKSSSSRLPSNKLTNHRLVGDVDFDNALGYAGMITPVPGGVGPVTVAMLLRNTVLACSYHCQEQLLSANILNNNGMLNIPLLGNGDQQQPLLSIENGLNNNKNSHLPLPSSLPSSNRSPIDLATLSTRATLTNNIHNYPTVDQVEINALKQKNSKYEF